MQIQKNPNQISWWEKIYAESSILDRQGLQLLINWMPRRIIKIELQFKASSNDFKIYKYFDKVGESKNNIIVVKTWRGKIFGGFTPVTFYPESGQQYLKWGGDQTLTSFVFSVSEKQKFQMLDPQCAIIRYRDKITIQFFDKLAIGNQANKASVFGILNYFSLGDDLMFYNTSKYPSSKQNYLKLTGYQDGLFLAEQWQAYQVTFEE